MKKSFTTSLLLLTLIFFTSANAQYIWNQIDNYPGGKCNGIYTKGDTLYTTINQNIYYSTDKGKLWNKEQTNKTIRWITFTKDGGYVALIEEPIYNLNISRSTDLHHWSSKLFGSFWGYASDALGDIYVVLDSMVYKSIDNGVSWDVNLRLGNNFDRPSLVMTRDFIYIIGYSTFYRKAVVEGSAWIKFQLPSDYFGSSLTADDNGSVYLVSYYGLIRYSGDNGETWTTKGSFPLFWPTRDQYACNQNNFMISYNDSVYFSTNYGVSWSLLLNGLPGKLHIHGLIWYKGSYFLNLYGYGIFRYDERVASWRPLLKGMNEIAFTGIVLCDDLSLLASTYGRGILRSTDKGNSWLPCKVIEPDDIYPKEIKKAPNGDLYACLSKGIYRSTDNGFNWIALTSPSPFYSLYELVFDKRGLLYFYSFNLFVSTDKGTTWNKIFNSTSYGGVGVSPKGVIFLVDGVYDGDLYRSTDRGESWQVFNDYRVYNSPLCDDYGNVLVPSVSLLRSTDEGISWKRYQNVLGNFIMFFTDNKGNYFASIRKIDYLTEQIDLMHSTDTGSTWKSISGNLPGNLVNSLLCMDNKLLAATDGGIWQLSNPLNSTMEKRTQPFSFEILQNYPNPFNPSTKIRFNIAKAGLVKIIIYDVLGKEVNLLINQYKDTGTYEIVFDGSKLPTGIYFYTIISGSYNETKKMILLR